MEPSDTAPPNESQHSTRTTTTQQRIVYKRAQVLAEMNETINTLTTIEEVLNEINHMIRPIADLGDDRFGTNAKPEEEATTVSQKMNKLIVELEKWEENC
jgi:uncharacterized protein YeeX (DUF496 family)